MSEKEQIRETVASIAELTDQQRWEKLEQLFITNPFVDEQMLTKQQAGITPVRSLINTWRKELTTYFYASRRNIKKLVVKVVGRKEAQAESDTEMNYFISDKGERYVWKVEGIYQYKLVKRAGMWKVSQLRFVLKNQTLRPVGV